MLRKDQLKESNAIQKWIIKAAINSIVQILEGNRKSVWIVEGGIDALALRDLALRQEARSANYFNQWQEQMLSFLEA